MSFIHSHSFIHSFIHSIIQSFNHSQLPCKSAYILLHGPDCTLIAGGEEKNDDSSLDWNFNRTHFYVCKIFAGIYVI